MSDNLVSLDGALSPGIYFFAIIGKFGVLYFNAFATDANETTIYPP